MALYQEAIRLKHFICAEEKYLIFNLIDLICTYAILPSFQTWKQNPCPRFVFGRFGKLAGTEYAQFCHLSFIDHINIVCKNSFELFFRKLLAAGHSRTKIKPGYHLPAGMMGNPCRQVLFGPCYQFRPVSPEVKHHSVQIEVESMPALVAMRVVRNPQLQSGIDIICCGNYLSPLLLRTMPLFYFVIEIIKVQADYPGIHLG